MSDELEKWRELVRSNLVDEKDIPRKLSITWDDVKYDNHNEYLSWQLFPTPIQAPCKLERIEDMDSKKFTTFDTVKKATKPRYIRDNREVDHSAKSVKPVFTWEFKGKKLNLGIDGDTVNDFYLNPKQIKMGSHILKVIESGNNTNVLALGDAGTGKTTYIKTLCNQFGIPFFYMNCAIFRDPTEWFGQMTIQGGDTKFEYSPLANFIIKGGGVVIFDELNRTDEFTRGILLSLLDDTRKVVIQDNEINVGKGLVFYATANIGFGYTGTHTFDIAEFRRFLYMEFSQLTIQQEIDILVGKGCDKEIANRITTIMTSVKNKLQSSGTLEELNFTINISKCLQVYELTKSGLSIQDAFVFAVLDGMQANLRMSVQSIINGAY